MSPVIDVVWSQSLSPFLDGDVPFDEALNMAQVPLREFMFAQTRESDLAMFAELGGYGAFASREDVPLFCAATVIFDQRVEDRVSDWLFVVRALPCH